MPFKFPLLISYLCCNLIDQWMHETLLCLVHQLTILTGFQDFFSLVLGASVVDGQLLSWVCVPIVFIRSLLNCFCLVESSVF